MALLACYETKAEYLVDLTYEEIEPMLLCVYTSKIKTLCNEVDINCFSKLPKKVSDADTTCYQEATPGTDKFLCDVDQNQYPPKDIIPKVYQCTDDKVKSLNDEEKKKVQDFEACVSASGKACKEQNQR
ncbi:hypothetical protein JTE90_022449 [Oedothorax gibbosus]|uniref:Uncharacterized protein n=1 Tax=Oedothorax gibbosus TaxID=931172 RepID=A0AAV6TXT1_9ARAC|nr:hypothetical protein JTE90_022449 [Oedothorax gibbosus]